MGRDPSGRDMRASSRIEQFLKDHPDGDLLIAVGYATAPGVAWLAKRTAGRRVCLLIGNARRQYWDNVAESDRAACLEFIARSDVEVRNWYRTKRSNRGESAAHLKVWAVHDGWSPVAVLVGSGNLTRKGLDHNVEAMAEAHGSDRRQTWDAAHNLWRKAWPCAARLIGYLNEAQPPAGRQSSLRQWQRQTGGSTNPDPAPAPAAPKASRVPSPQTGTHGMPVVAASQGADMAAAEQQRTPQSQGYTTPRLGWVEGTSVAGFLLAAAGAVAPIIDIRRRGLWDAVISWECLAEALCLVVGIGCGWWARERSGGMFKWLAYTGIAVSVAALAALFVALVAFVVLWALPVLKLLAAGILVALLLLALGLVGWERR